MEGPGHTNAEAPLRNVPAVIKGAELYPALVFVLDEVRRDPLYSKRLDERNSSSDELLPFIDRVADRLGFALSPRERDLALSHLERDRKPFGLLQELVDDPSVTDIIVTDFSTVTVQRARRNLTTRLSFPSQSYYEAFVEKILARAKASYSTKQPIADGVIDSFARIHAVHKCLCESGPYLTIRLNRFDSVSTSDLVSAGVAPRDVFSYLTAIVSAGRTVLIAGEVGTGKATLTRALASSLPTDESILVIEDTPEIRLEHPHVRYLTTRVENAEGVGRVTPSECIRAGMRMAMNRIVFGEIRDAEAAESFIDVCASGHPGLSTIHARSAQETVARLELFLGRAQPGIGKTVASEQVATAVQVIVHIGMCVTTGRRRILEVKEIGPLADGVLRQRSIFAYDGASGVATWRIQGRVSAHREVIEPRCVLSALPPVLTLDGAVR